MAEPTRRQQAFEVLVDLLDLEPVPRRLRPTTGGGRTEGRLLGVIPEPNGPRFLVALDHPRAAAATCLTYGAMRAPANRAMRALTGVALGARAGRAVTRDEYLAATGEGSLLGMLADLLGEEELVPFLGVSNLDAVWKPTVQVYGPDGRPLAFVKVGVGPVPRRLVTTEADVLRRWGEHPDPRIVVPELIAETTFRDHPVAVIAPLPLDTRRLPSGPISADPVRRLDGPPWTGPLGASPWWTRRREAAASDGRVDALLARIEKRHQGLGPTWARWHGDWVPWNLARCRTGLVAWDWEYSEPDAPVGLDEVHAVYQGVRVHRGGSAMEGFAAVRRATESRWLADAQVAMAVTRAGELERLTGQEPPGKAELLAAAEAIAT